MQFRLISENTPKGDQPEDLLREADGPKVPKKKAERNERLSRRALKDLQEWLTAGEKTTA